MYDFYCVPTANGQKAAIMLEEVGARYTVHQIDLQQGEHLSPEYLAVNPVGKVPTIIDHDTGDGSPLTVYGTLAICLYLAEKHECLLPTSRRDRAAVYQWSGFVASDIGPNFTGQFIFNVIAPEKIPYAIELYDQQIHRMLKALDDQLAGSPYVAGEAYTIADVLAYPVAATSAPRLPGGLEPYAHIAGWAERVGQRPAVQSGMAASERGLAA